MVSAYAPGRALLRRAADEYRAHPEMWTRGYGIYIDDTSIPDKPPVETLDRIKRCCMEVMLRRFAAACGARSLEQARYLLYVQIGGPYLGRRQRIWSFNDDKDRTVEQVIDCLESASRRRIVTIGDYASAAWHYFVVWTGAVPAFG